MKLSLKLPDHQHQHEEINPLLTAKIPVSIFNHPFLTSVSTASLSSDLSFSLSSNFPSGPSLKLSYSPTATPSLSPPFSLSLKSGLGLFGSPANSPLVFKAHWSLSSPNPTFSLLFKPQFGHFSLKKTSLSNPRGTASVPEPISSSESSSNGVWQQVKLEPCDGDSVESSSNSKRVDNDGVFSGIAVMARTNFPLGKRVAMDMRWGVNLPVEFAAKMPRLTMSKISIERIESEKEKDEKNQRQESSDLGLLKGMCLWMSRDLEALERENREMKRSLEEMMRVGVGASNVKRSQALSHPRSEPRVAPAGSSVEFEKWKSKKKSVSEENSRRDAKKPSPASDLESELQRAIAAAAGSSV